MPIETHYFQALYNDRRIFETTYDCLGRGPAADDSGRGPCCWGRDGGPANLSNMLLLVLQCF